MTKPAFQYKFTTEDGMFVGTHAEYVANTKLRAKVMDKTGNRYRLVLGRQIFSFPLDFLKDNKDTAQLVGELDRLNTECAIQFFAPTCRASEEFLNDTEHDVLGIVCPNQVGKTQHAIIRDCMALFPCDPSWPMFKEYGVKWRPWGGPIRMAVSTYTWTLALQTLWPLLRRWIPDSELGPYSQRYVGPGKSYPTDKRPRVPLKCGSEIHFFTADQNAGAYESGVFKHVHHDEQPRLYQFNGFDERTRTVGGMHIFSLTPHAVEGRPDTGYGSWLHGLFTDRPMGHKVRSLTWSVNEALDWYYPEESKKAAYEKWVVEPRRTGDKVAMAEGQARYYGKWHRTSGMVFPMWDRQVHVIDPFPIPKTATIYRGVDHGERNETAGLYAAALPDGDIILFAEYYRRGLSVYENVRGIVQACGNSLKEQGELSVGGGKYVRYVESPDKFHVRKTVLDRRSMAQTDSATGKTRGWLYKMAGLNAIPASGARDEDALPFLRDLLRIDPNRKHRVTGKPGAPRVYVFRTLVNMVSELEGFVWAPPTVRNDNFEAEKTKKGKEHLIDCAKYLAQIPMVYVGRDMFEEQPEESGDTITGY